MSLVPTEVVLSNDEQVLVEAAREFAREQLLPLDRKWDQGESCVAEALPALAEMGLLNLCIPAELGGLGCSCRVYASILHELSYASPSVAVTVSVHSMVGQQLLANGKEPRRSEWVSHWGEPGHFAAFALSEADAGSDIAAVRAIAKDTGDGFVVSGEKMWITNGLSARWILTLLRLEGGSHNGKLCALLVDGEMPGIERTKIDGKMGIRGSETAVLHFSDVLVPEDHLLGKRGQGQKVCLSTLNEGRVGIAAQATGIGEACLDAMVAYAKQRRQFGKPIGAFQSVSNMIADSAVELAAARALIWRAATLIDRGVKSPAASSTAKLYASEAANRIAYRAVQIHGGTGYVSECRVEQLFRDARVTTIYEGTSEIQRVVIARELLGRL